MMLDIRKTLLNLSALILTMQSTLAGSEPLKPAKSWTLDYGDTKCLASRIYNVAGKDFALAFRPSLHGKVMTIFLMRPGHTPYAEHVAAAVKISNTTFKTTALHYEGDGKHEILKISIDEAAVEKLRDAKTLTIEASGTKDYNFSIPGMGKVLSAIEECNRSLRTYWNADGELQSTFKSQARPVAPLYSYMKADDYPTQAIRDRREGTVKVNLMIDEAGLLKDCAVEETSGVATLDAQTCYALSKRAKFLPAIDSKGQPVRSTLSTRVTWRL